MRNVGTRHWPNNSVIYYNSQRPGLPRAPERAKSTRKGGDFESSNRGLPTAESRPRKDLVRRTSTEYGLDQNMAGDFVIEINPWGSTRRSHRNREQERAQRYD